MEPNYLGVHSFNAARGATLLLIQDHFEVHPAVAATGATLL